MKLLDKCAIITGGTRGLGYVIAKKYIENGASVVICGRDIEYLKNAEKSLNELSGPDQIVICLQKNVSLEEDIKELIECAHKNMGKIDIVVNNAGIHGPKGLVESVDSDEWLEAIKINLFSVFYMCKWILPHMKERNTGKIINISGGGATAPFPRISAYAASKAGVVRFTETLSEECKGYNIDINALAPGSLNTRLLDDILESGPQNVGNSLFEKALKQKEEGGVSPELGADLCVFLASDDSNGITGKLISAVWDPWHELTNYKDDLVHSDIYTLRRITEKERGKNWDHI
jgi:NAD(P)-dependent dehydrogenase (short-subunit alcohol dehydrogenase family)